MTIRYQEIGRYLRDRIAEGTYPPDTAIPSIPALMEEFGVARDTVRDAVARLANEGIVTPRRGVGTIVRDSTPVSLAYQPGKAAAVWSEQADSGPDSDRVVDAGWDAPDREITSQLDLPPTSEVVRRVRHQSKGEHIAQVHEQWIPDYVANMITEATGVDLADANVVPYTDLYSLMRETGETPSTVSETISTRMPSPDEAELLYLTSGIPVLITHRVTRNNASIPLETSIFTGAGDRMSQSFTLPLS